MDLHFIRANPADAGYDAQQRRGFAATDHALRQQQVMDLIEQRRQRMGESSVLGAALSGAPGGAPDQGGDTQAMAARLERAAQLPGLQVATRLNLMNHAATLRSQGENRQLRTDAQGDRTRYWADREADRADSRGQRTADMQDRQHQRAIQTMQTFVAAGDFASARAVHDQAGLNLVPPERWAALERDPNLARSVQQRAQDEQRAATGSATLANRVERAFTDQRLLTPRVGQPGGMSDDELRAAIRQRLSGADAPAAAPSAAPAPPPAAAPRSSNFNYEYGVEPGGGGGPGDQPTGGSERGPMSDASPGYAPGDQLAQRPQPPSQPPAAGGPSASYFDTLQRQESGGNPTATNPRSSAVGPYQFLSSTWLGRADAPGIASRLPGVDPQLLARAYAGDQQAQQQILAMRTDPTMARAGAAEYARQAAVTLRQAGVPVNDTTLALAHFLGPAGAVRFLGIAQRNPNAPIGSAVSDAALRANPEVLRGTVGDLLNTYSQRYGGGTSALGAPAAPGAAPAAPARPGVPAQLASAGPAPATAPAAAPPPVPMTPDGQVDVARLQPGQAYTHQGASVRLDPQHGWTAADEPRASQPPAAAQGPGPAAPDEPAAPPEPYVSAPASAPPPALPVDPLHPSAWMIPAAREAVAGAGRAVFGMGPTDPASIERRLRTMAPELGRGDPNDPLLALQSEGAQRVAAQSPAAVPQAAALPPPVAMPPGPRGGGLGALDYLMQLRGGPAAATTPPQPPTTGGDPGLMGSVGSTAPLASERFAPTPQGEALRRALRIYGDMPPEVRVQAPYFLDEPQRLVDWAQRRGAIRPPTDYATSTETGDQ